ncbi:alpha-L-rhamnosidase-related protein [Sphaerisporangium perillae]|uniref:alpha-L-rhamnosidase-related protein n=1 Tax=Sphaerisporangium perillae TaxID=2935860 RepID=UPI00200E6E04|nr:hypothetical protein [Sphaerisporangium perillae]
MHGYRYVELTGFPGTPTTAGLTGLAAWTDGAETGTFTSSSTLVNQLQHNILWGARSNMLSVPTDCPQRDERHGWTGTSASSPPPPRSTSTSTGSSTSSPTT